MIIRIYCTYINFSSILKIGGTSENSKVEEFMRILRHEGDNIFFFNKLFVVVLGVPQIYVICVFDH